MSGTQSGNIDPAELERRFDELAGSDAATREIALRAMARTTPVMARRLAALLDAHLRHADEVEQLGASARSALGLFDTEALVGRELDGWHLTEVLGRGGMGVVFGAQRVREGVRQDAAIKLLSIPLFDAGAAERFRHEALALARLDHPGICRLRDFGRSPEGWPFLVLDRVDGAALHRYAEAKPLVQKLSLVARVADAVAAAHRQLVVHLDIKPENVLVTPAGDPVLLDFGIARVLGEDGEASATATVARWLTPDYAAPERLRGEASTVAADIHSLGALLYRIVTGRTPFDLAGLSVTDAVARIEKGPEPPSRVLGTLPRDLDAVIARAMHPDPARRYASAGDFAADLRAIIERRPVKARPDSLGYRLRTALRRHPVVLPAGVLAGVAILAMAAVLAWQAADLRQQRDRAEREAARASLASRYLIDSLEAINPKTRSETGIGLTALLDATEERLRLQGTGDPRLQVDLYLQVGRIRVSLGEDAAALALFDRALELAQGEDSGIEAVQQAAIQSERAGSLRAMGRLDEALEAATHAVALAGERGSARIFANRRMAQVLEYMGRYDEARELVQLSLPLLEPDNLTGRAGLYNDLAAIGLAELDFEAAERGARQAYELYRQAYSEPHLDTTEAAWRLAAGLLNQGRAAEAEQLLEEALAIRRTLYGEEHHLVGEVMTVLSGAQSVLGKAEPALANALRADEIYAATLVPDSPRHVMTLGAAGNLLRDAGRLDEARVRFARGLQVARKAYGDGPHLVTAFFVQALATVDALLEDFSSAHDLLHEALAMHEALDASDRTNAMYIRHSLASVLRSMDDVAAALPEAEAAWELAQALLPEDDAERALVRSELGHVLLLAGQHEAGREHLLTADQVIGGEDSPLPLVNRIGHARAMLVMHERSGDARGQADMQARISSLEADRPSAAVPPATP